MISTYKLEIEIETDEKLIIGTGQTDFKPSRFQQIQKMKIGIEDIPIIPATTIKGVLRTHSMKIAHLLALNSCGQIKPGDIAEAHKKIKCDVCHIFGAPNSPSKIIVEDAISQDKNILLDHYSGIKLNRKKGVTEKGALFQYEAIGKGQKFIFNIICNGLTLNESKLLIYAIRELQYNGFGRHNGALNIKILNKGELTENLKNIIEEAFLSE